MTRAHHATAARGLAAALLLAAAAPAVAQQAAPPPADRPAPSAARDTARDTTPAAKPRQRWGFGPTQMKLIVQVDYARGTDSRAQFASPSEGFGLRRTRLILQGAAPLGLGYGVHLDASNLAGGPDGAPPFRGAPLAEAYLDYRLHRAALVRVGQQRVLFGLNSTTGAPALATPEFAQFARAVQQRVSAFRDIGVSVQGRIGALEYAGGVFNGSGINVAADNDSTKDVAVRLTYALAPGLTVGTNGWVGHSPRPYVRAGETRPAAAFNDNADFRRYGLDARYARGPVLVTAELARNRTEHAPGATTPTPRGAALEQTGYNVLGAVRLGALAPALRRVEVVGRYDVWDPDGGLANDRTVEIVTGVNLHLAEVEAPTDRRLGRAANFVQRSSRLMLFLEHSRFGRARPGPPTASRLHARWSLFL